MFEGLWQGRCRNDQSWFKHLENSGILFSTNIQGWFPLRLTGLISLLRNIWVHAVFLKCLLQHHSSKASVLQHSVFFIVQLTHPHLTTGKTMAMTIWTLVGKVMSLLFNTLSRFAITFLPRSKHLSISWLNYCLQWFWSSRK